MTESTRLLCQALRLRGEIELFERLSTCPDPEARTPREAELFQKIEDIYESVVDGELGAIREVQIRQIQRQIDALPDEQVSMITLVGRVFLRKKK